MTSSHVNFQILSNWNLIFLPKLKTEQKLRGYKNGTNQLISSVSKKTRVKMAKLQFILFFAFVGVAFANDIQEDASLDTVSFKFHFSDR